MANPYGQMKHGLCGTPLYNVWSTMKQRCDNPNDKHYKWYGAKGISYCKEWSNVENFVKWCEENGYKKGLTLDRIDPTKNYEPSNCRFITMSEQQSNKTSNHLIKYNGETHTLTQWSKILGISRSTLSGRIVISGWSIERAFTEEVRT